MIEHLGAIISRMPLTIDIRPRRPVGGGEEGVSQGYFLFTNFSRVLRLKWADIPINFALPTAAAQTPTAGDANPASPRPKSDAPPGNPTDAQRQTARQLVELLHPDYELSVVLANKLNPFALRLTVETPDNVERVRAAREAESKTLRDTLPALKFILVEAYAREMTHDQLEDMLKFLGTPPGLAFSRAQGRLPLYFEISGADVWGHYVHSMLVEFCARTACTDKDRELMNEGVGAVDAW